MTFITAGLAVAGVLAMAIPILIHLLWRQRRKPIEWAAMRFLIEAYRRHRRRLRLEQLLLLALRCLILGLLGLALARPILKSNVLDLGGSRSVYLVIDDGLASALVQEDGTTALQGQGDQARAIIDALDPGDFVGVVTTARPAKAQVVPPSSDHQGVLDLIEGLEPSEAPSDIGRALSLLRSAVDDSDRGDQNTLVYLLSGFRAGSAPLDQPLPAAWLDSPPGVRLLASTPAQTPIPNTQIVSIDPVRAVVVPGAADGSGQVTVRVQRHGGQLDRAVTRVRVSGEDIFTVEPKLIEWDPGQSEAEVEFGLDFSVQGDREIAITATIDDDRMGPDNSRYSNLQSRDRIRVLLIDRRSFGFEPEVNRLSPGRWMRRALEPVSEGTMQVVEVAPVAIGTADLRRSDVALLPRPDLVTEDGWRLLREFVDGGGLLVITPPADLQVHQWVDQFGSALELPWRVGLEVVDHEAGLMLASEQDGGQLLQMVSSELPQLTRAVIAHRVLPVIEDDSQGQRVLRFADDSSMLLVGGPQPKVIEGESAPDPSRGLVAYFAVAPDLRWTNLPTKPLMVPLLHELIRQGLGVIRTGQPAAVGATRGLGLPFSAATLEDADGERMPLLAGSRPQQPLSHSGHWTVRDAAGLPVGALAVNIEPAAARSQIQTPGAVSAWLNESGRFEVVPAAQLTGALQTVESGSPVSRTLLILLAILVVAETVLARWFSHARVRRSGRGDTANRAPLSVGAFGSTGSAGGVAQ